MAKRLAVLIILLSAMPAFKAVDPPLFSFPEGWPAPHYDFSKNPLADDKVLLGRVLFYDPILSANQTISCASCHLQYTAFAHTDHALSHGINDRIGTRNAPALINLAWKTSFMWDGAINHLDMQALAPISHPDEMDETIENAVKKLQASPVYPNLFRKAFGDSGITGANTLKALSSFMLTLVSCHSKYDSVMQKRTVFTPQEDNGYRLFRAHCGSCHTEPLFSSERFENNGLPGDPGLKDMGRMRITQKAGDSLKFMVPSLRNIEFSYPYMHDGRFKSLYQVLNHYTNGVHQSPTLSEQLLKPMILSANEKTDMIAFLMTLTDRSFLFNPRYGFPKQILLPAKDK